MLSNQGLDIDYIQVLNTSRIYKEYVGGVFMEEVKKDEKLLETTGFVSRGFGSRQRFGANLPMLRSSAVSDGRSNRNNRKVSTYLLIRLGICAILFCGVMFLKLNGNEKALAVIGKAAYNDGVQENDEESLGRLKFVELPSIIDVFAPAYGYVLPIEASGYELSRDGFVLTLDVDSDTSVISPVKGRVKALSRDDELGDYIAISEGEDVEINIYGLGKIDVERGQPLKQGQKLGEAAGERLVIKVYRDGRPEDVSSVFELEKKA